MGVVYLVSTPIGNLADITIRALDTLRSASLIVAEDTRHTRKLLSHYDVHRPLLSLHEHSSAERVAEIIEAARSGDVALVTDAGTPGVSDPGREVVLAAAAAGIPISAAPGPSATLTALVLSGLPADSFLFLGFLPRKDGALRGALGAVRALPHTLVLFEAPHRLVHTLDALLRELGDRPIAVARELTKLHEEVRRSTLAEEAAHWRSREPRGEFTLVVGGARARPADTPEADPLEEVHRLILAGARPSEAIKQVAEGLGVPRKQLYRSWLDAEREAPA